MDVFLWSSFYGQGWRVNIEKEMVIYWKTKWITPKKNKETKKKK